MNKIFTMFLVIFMIAGFQTYAQPPSFTLSGISVAQTCLGNGSITLSPSGNDPTASMEYAVYLLPNITTPVTTVTIPQVTGLIAGTYQIKATQLLNGSSNTATATIMVGDDIVPLQYTATGSYCNGEGTITVDVTSGSEGASYEILSGPQVRPLQSSNIFNGLPQGQYQVRVFNACGEGLVTTVQLTIATAALLLQGHNIVGGALPSCNTIRVTNSFLNSFPTLWPVTFEYKVYPPGGGDPDIITRTEEAQTITTEIPFYNNQLYSYYLTITDACGNQATQFYSILKDIM